MNLMLQIKLDDKKDGIKKVINQKLNRLKRILDDNTKVSWNYFSENGMYFSEVYISGFSGNEIKARASSKQEYKVIDSAYSKIKTQLNKRTNKQKSRKNTLKNKIHLSE